MKKIKKLLHNDYHYVIIKNKKKLWKWCFRKDFPKTTNQPTNQPTKNCFFSSSLSNDNDDDGNGTNFSGFFYDDYHSRAKKKCPRKNHHQQNHYHLENYNDKSLVVVVVKKKIIIIFLLHFNWSFKIFGIIIDFCVDEWWTLCFFCFLIFLGSAFFSLDFFGFQMILFFRMNSINHHYQRRFVQQQTERLSWSKKSINVFFPKLG